MLDYINPSRAFSLKCKDRLSEAFAVTMCTQGIACDLLRVGD